MSEKEFIYQCKVGSVSEGGRVYVKVDVSHIELAKQQVTVVKIRDMTDYVKKREYLSAEEHKRTLTRRVETAKVAHELRTPLASM